MKLYIYKSDSKEIVAVAERETNAECEDAASIYLGCDDYGAAYNTNELIETADYENL